jgi:ElaB/YqjD/DUF883 family membrane-anchored ribosome-binding protein/uncharacterized protein YjbJ (UPF0337 family)
MGQSTEELTRNIEETRQNLSQDVDELTDKVSPSRIVHRRKEAAKSRLGSIREQIMGTVQDSGSAVTSAGHGVADSASSAVESVGSKAQGNPLGAGLVAFGAGLVIGSLFPATDAEAQVSQRAVDLAKEQGQPLVEEAKSVGQEIAGNLKETAVEAADEVKVTAQESAENLKGEAQTSGENLKDATPGM